MQGQRAGHDILFVDGIGDQLLGEFRGFPVGDHPTDDVAAENIEDHVQVKVRPLDRPLQFRNIPAPDFVRPDREQFGLGIHGMTPLSAPITDLTVGG